jgi:hypothetical protein
VEEVPQEQVARVHDVVQVPAAARELEPGFDQSAPFGDPFVVSDLLAEVAVCDRGVLGRQSELERKVHRPSKIVDTATIARIDARDTPHAERTNDVGIADLARELDRLLGPFQPLLGAAADGIERGQTRVSEHELRAPVRLEKPDPGRCNLACSERVTVSPQSTAEHSHRDTGGAIVTGRS